MDLRPRSRGRDGAAVAARDGGLIVYEYYADRTNLERYNTVPWEGNRR
jgi:hypothetical protein